MVTSVDLYDLLLKGDRSADRVMQADDVIHVGPVGPQVALIGSVNQPAIFELKPGETVTDLLRMAGGFSTVADTTRLAVERLDDRATVRITQIDSTRSSVIFETFIPRGLYDLGPEFPLARGQNMYLRCPETNPKGLLLPSRICRDFAILSPIALMPLKNNEVPSTLLF